MNAMQKKLGPLPVWQWILIGAVVGLGTYLYERRAGAAGAAAQDATAAATPADAQYEPIDPTTGLPIAGGISTGADTTGDATDTSGTGSLADLLTNFQSLEDLLAGLSEITPAAPGPAVNTDQGQVKNHTGTKKAKPKKHKARKPAKKKVTTGGHKNPGHHVTHHGHGKKTAGSSAPHNDQQHKHVQAPSHQRHPATTHPSAHHPSATHPIPAHQRHPATRHHSAGHYEASRLPRRRRRI